MISQKLYLNPWSSSFKRTTPPRAGRGWELFERFWQFQLLFPRFFPAFGLYFGAVLAISAFSATFSWVFPAFGLDFGAVLEVFGITAPKLCLLCHHPITILDKKVFQKLETTWFKGFVKKSTSRIQVILKKHATRVS